MRILISAAEVSSDLHASHLLRALKAREPGLQAVGVGGPALQREGLEPLADARELLAMGTTEVLSRLPRILRVLKRLVSWIETNRPDAVVVVDYPDFHMRLAKRIRHLGVPLIYYIPPKVWVWRSHRVAKLRRLFDRLLCIFPFEEGFYSERGVTTATYVGNPLTDELPLGLSRADARKRLGIEEAAFVCLVMAGSRPYELDRHLEAFLSAVKLLGERLGRSVEVLFPLAAATRLEPVQARVQAWTRASGGGEIRVRVSQGDAAVCMAAADVGLIKSGTSTLEAALMGCPHAIAYRASWLTCWIFKKWVKYRGPVGLANLVHGGRGVTDPSRWLVRELLCAEATVEALSAELWSLSTDAARRETMRQGLAEIRESLLGGAGAGPSARAADEILRMANGGRS